MRKKKPLYPIRAASFVGLAISFAVVLIMGAFMLSQMSAIINGGETNYISATVDLYLAHKKGWFVVE
jgi:hypothetical protein